MNHGKNYVCLGSSLLYQTAVGERAMDGVHAKLPLELLSLFGGAHQGRELKLVPLGMSQEMRKYASTNIT